MKNMNHESNEKYCNFDFFFSFSACVVHHDYHVVIGTHREVISFSLLGVFKTNFLAIVVFDDADYTATTSLVKAQLINKLPHTCQKVFISPFSMIPNLTHNLVEMKLLVDGTVFPHQSIVNYYVECITNQKYDIIKKLSSEANKYVGNGQIIVFFTVCLNIFF